MFWNIFHARKKAVNAKCCLYYNSIVLATFSEPVTYRVTYPILVLGLSLVDALVKVGHTSLRVDEEVICIQLIRHYTVCYRVLKNTFLSLKMFLRVILARQHAN